MAMDILGAPAHEYVWKNRGVYFGSRTWSRGVTKTIRRIFASTYRFSQLPRRRCLRLAGLPYKQAKRRGHAIDRTLSRWASGQSLARTKIKEPGVLLEIFTVRGWKPVGSQVVVAWPEARLATRIDLVLFDSTTQRLLVVEVKSGCLYRRQSHGYLAHVQPRVTNAPLHQHQLQVVLGKELLVRTYPQWTRSQVDCVLIYVNHHLETEVVEECEFGIQYSSCIRDVLLRTA
jgi:hypothetical protein